MSAVLAPAVGLSLRTGFVLALTRLKQPVAVLALSLGVLLVLIAALLERRSGPAGAVDRALTGVVFGLTLPLLSYAIVSRATERLRLEDAVISLTRWGARRDAAALGVLAACATSAAAVGASLAALGVIVAHVPSEGSIMADLAISGWLGLVAGAAYATLFCFGATIGARGGGRLALLALDWMLGSGVGAAAVPFLRGHVRNLLGAEPVLGMPQWAALLSVALVGTVCALATVWRCRH